MMSKQTSREQLLATTCRFLPLIALLLLLYHLPCQLVNYECLVFRIFRARVGRFKKFGWINKDLKE